MFIRVWFFYFYFFFFVADWHSLQGIFRCVLDGMDGMDSYR